MLKLSNLTVNHLKLAALSGATSVALGAFGAHKLKSVLSVKMFEAYQTAVFYQFIHSLLLLILGLAIIRLPHVKALKISATFATLGIVLFSGSLYFMSLTGITSYAIITPVGGLSLILAWLSVLFISTNQIHTNHRSKHD